MEVVELASVHVETRPWTCELVSRSQSPGGENEGRKNDRRQRIISLLAVGEWHRATGGFTVASEQRRVSGGAECSSMTVVGALRDTTRKTFLL